MTRDDLLAVMPVSGSRADTFAAPLTAAMSQYQINTPLRQAAFLAQIAEESGELRYVEEIASGAAYEGRADLGNTQPGDGVKFKGRGLIQITGRAEYTECEQALCLDLLNHPELLATPENAALSAAWFWESRGLNTLADADRFGSITRRINGGYNGLDDRIRYYVRARQRIGASP